MDQRPQRRRFLHWLFEAGVIIKGINGFLELVGGFLLLITSTEQLNTLVVSFTQQEFSGDPDDAVATMLVTFVSHLQIGTKTFGAVYLIGHGILKIFLVYHLLKERLWVFPVAIGVMEAFALYQLYRIGIHHSFVLKVFTSLDILVIGFIWNEWKAREKMVIRIPRAAC